MLPLIPDDCHYLIAHQPLRATAVYLEQDVPCHLAPLGEASTDIIHAHRTGEKTKVKHRLGDSPRRTWLSYNRRTESDSLFNYGLRGSCFFFFFYDLRDGPLVG